MDLKAGRLIINQTLGYTLEDGIYMKDAKTDESHATVTIAPLTVEALRAHRAGRNKRRLKKGEEWQNYDLVCDRGNGAPCHPDSVSSWSPGWIKGRGIDGITFHGLRHAHATWLISLGLHPKEIQERLRHRDISTTMNIYGHLMPGLDEQAAAIEKSLRDVGDPQGCRQESLEGVAWQRFGNGFLRIPRQRHSQMALMLGKHWSRRPDLNR